MYRCSSNAQRFPKVRITKAVQGHREKATEKIFLHAYHKTTLHQPKLTYQIFCFVVKTSVQDHKQRKTSLR